MKRFATILFLLCFIVGITAGPITIQLFWNGQPNVDAYKIYGTNSLSVPQTNWPLLTVVGGTVSNTSLTMQPQQFFFYVTASNFWGESIPSNVANTPSPATNVAGVTITR